MAEGFDIRPHPGRPRSERARQAVLEAAADLFEEGGYPAATIEAIASRSGVAKTTIYRWWPNRPALIVDLLLQLASAAAPPPVAGRDPVRALRIELHRVASAMDALPGRLLGSLVGEAHQDPEVRDALLRGLFLPRRQATAEVIRQAQREGALRANVSPFVAVDLFFGPLFYRKYVRQEPVTRAFVQQVFEGVLEGLGARGAGTRAVRASRPRRAPATGARAPRKPRARSRSRP